MRGPDARPLFLCKNKLCATFYKFARQYNDMRVGSWLPRKREGEQRWMKGTRKKERTELKKKLCMLHEIGGDNLSLPVVSTTPMESEGIYSFSVINMTTGP